MSQRLLALMMVLITFTAACQGSGGQTVAQAPSFSFTTASDYAQNSTTTLSLKKIAGAKVNFHLGLGDYSYVTPSNDATVDSWVSYARANMGNVPFVVLAGNHDHNIDRYVTDLPNPVAAVGTYGREYYFDYPSATPLARIIAIAPTQVPGDLYGWTYAAGTEHYNFLVNAIDTARAKGIAWVIVAMHEPCLTVQSTGCDGTTGQRLLNLLVEKKVDLVLGGHKHDIEVSKQLALGTDCPKITLTTVNPACIVNGTSSMSKGAGTVFATYSTAGVTPLTLVRSPAVTKSYFRAWMDSSTWGVAKFTLTSTMLSQTFLNAEGNFTDSFTIHS